jgi:hypothetical protein
LLEQLWAEKVSLIFSPLFVSLTLKRYNWLAKTTSHQQNADGSFLMQCLPKNLVVCTFTSVLIVSERPPPDPCPREIAVEITIF